MNVPTDTPEDNGEQQKAAATGRCDHEAGQGWVDLLSATPPVLTSLATLLVAVTGLVALLLK
ncbi:hypothetical protein [Micromonospora fulviviridis]|uniref:Uncharacterized protein n=1 Tax=Micromonospora fulviviridis TaxID=47860 RepID=A0ABV2VDS2_9ACTN